ncbi:hypothetical protein GCM10010344_22060 [Streptomyces bluensis]|nr:hypothetical protein GCM10010344_22060 [Streptomyces bluensis]
MTKGYEGYTGTGRRGPVGPSVRPAPKATGSAGTVCGTGTPSGHAGIPFPGHLFRVSGFLREGTTGLLCAGPHARRTAPDGWMRHA